MRIVILVACLWLVTSPLYAKIVFSAHHDDARYKLIQTEESEGA